jgi:hypothetical protein
MSRDSDNIASYAIIDEAGAGDNEVIAAPAAGFKLLIWGFAFVVAGAVNVRFEGGAGGTALTGVMNFASAGQGMAVPVGRKPIFEIAAATNFNAELSAAVSIDGFVVYSVVPA